MTERGTADVDRQLVDQLIDLMGAVANELHLKAIQLASLPNTRDDAEMVAFLRHQAARLRGDE